MNIAHYTYDPVESELNIYIRNEKGKIIYTESILGEFSDREDIEQTIREACSDYVIDSIIDDDRIFDMSELGRKSARARKIKGHDSKYYSELAKKRWAKQKRK